MLRKVNPRVVNIGIGIKEGNAILPNVIVIIIMTAV